jgi:hypothetical protein
VQAAEHSATRLANSSLTTFEYWYALEERNECVKLEHDLLPVRGNAEEEI